MVDMSHRLRRAEIVAIGGFVVLALVSLPTTGIGLIAATLVGCLFYGAVIARMKASRRPEHHSVAVLAVGQLALAAGIILSSGPRILLVAVLMGPMLLGAAVWPLRGVVAGTVATGLLMVAVLFAVDAEGVLQIPALACYPLAVLIAAVVVTTAARGADVASRATAVVDRLTGLLNRSALLPRAAELAHQSELTGEPVGLLLGDIDHFKLVNDEHGHARGDEALAGVAARLREAAGSDATLYRFGGEELVLLVPGADLAAAVELAERLRAALAREPVAGLPVTISFGVTASRRGEEFDFEALFAIADAALYAAKAEGRNRVCAASPGGVEQAARPLAHGGAHTADVVGRPGLRARMAGRRAQDRERVRPPEAAPASTATDEAGAAVLAARDARHRAATGSWLVRDEATRAHMLDLLHRIQNVRLLAYGAVFATLAVGGPTYGFWALLPPFVGALAMGVTLELSTRMRRPELAIFAAILFSMAANTVAFFLTHNRPIASLPLLVIIVCAWSPVFPARGVVILTVTQALLILAAALDIAGHATLSDPLVLGVPLCLLVAVAAIGSTIGRSSCDHRGAAVTDQLTGMLNRRALEARIAAVAHQAAFTGEAVSVVVGDIDHFKQINDRAGHRTGDAVLREIAYRLRKNLRAFEAAYRIGGEEFVVLLAGTPAAEAAQIAERLRTAIREETIEAEAVTMSFGVAGCDSGEAFDYEEHFARADAALYAAKVAGRDRVCSADPAPARPRPGETLRSAA
jgi:diguanylate cyclase (GGDEF)-like protein